MPSRFSMVLSCSLFTLCLGTDGRAADWAQWRGARRDNVCTETGLLKKWPKDGPKLLWTADKCGKGFSSVTIAGGRVYTAGKVGDRTVIYAFDMSGNLKWKAENGGSWEANPRHKWAIGNAGSRAVPQVDEGMVYHLNDLGRLVAFEAATGKERWAVDFAERFGSKHPRWGYSEMVLTDGETLVCYPGGPKGYMVALNKKTGKVVWANKDIGDGPSYCSAILVDLKGVRQVVTMTTKSIVGVRAENGKLLWRYPFENMRKINVSVPIYQDGHVFASSGYGRGSVLLRLTVAGDKVRAEKVWESKEMDNHHGGVVLVDGALYGSGHRAKGWRCLDFRTGAVLYREPGKGSLLHADGMLYCYDERGTMALVRTSPKGRKVVSSFKVPRGGKGHYWAHPVICDGRLYVRHASKLYVYDIKAGK